MVYRALTEYLLHRSPDRRAFMIAPSVLLLLLLAGLLSPALRIYLWAIALLGITLSIWITTEIQKRARSKSAETGTLETEDWLRSLVVFAERKQLEDRSHPALIPELEACAKLRRAVLDSLDSEEWKRLCGKKGWSEVREVCRETAEALFQDAIWASKGAIRPRGGRKETFQKRCQDPTFAARALNGVVLARIQLEKLMDEVSEQPFAAEGIRDALARAQSELKAIRDAEEEVRALQ